MTNNPKLWTIAFILTATSLPSTVMYGINPYLGSPSPFLIVAASILLAGASYSIKPEDTQRIRPMIMGTALVAGYALSVYGSVLGFSMGLNTLAVVVLSPFVFATLDDWRLRFAGYGIAGVLALYLAYALNHQIAAEVQF